MPFKRPDSPNWFVRPKLASVGRITARSTGTAVKAIAESMEAMLHELDIMGQDDLLKMLERGEIDLPDLYRAKVSGRLAELRSSHQDPLLADCVARLSPRITDKRVRQGLGQIADIAPPKARLSWLTDPRNISHLIAESKRKGQRENTVKRGLWRALSDLLASELGRTRKEQLLKEVSPPGEDDARNISVSTEKLKQLVAACEEGDFRNLVRTAMLTGVDQGPLCRALVRHFDRQAGTLSVLDTKTAARPRTLLLSSSVVQILTEQIAGKGPDDLLFYYTPPPDAKGRAKLARAGAWDASKVAWRWKKARAIAGLPTLRFKDLRHIFGDTWTRTGGTLKDLQQVLGHFNPSTTMIYTFGQATGDRGQMDRVARVLNLEEGI